MIKFDWHFCQLARKTLVFVTKLNPSLIILVILVVTTGCKHWQGFERHSPAWPLGAFILGLFMILGGMSAAEKSGFGGALIVLMGLIMVIIG